MKPYHTCIEASRSSLAISKGAFDELQGDVLAVSEHG